MVKPSYFLGRNVAAKWALLLLGNHDQWVKEAVIEITNICIYIYVYYINIYKLCICEYDHVCIEIVK